MRLKRNPANTIFAKIFTRITYERILKKSKIDRRINRKNKHLLPAVQSSSAFGESYPRRD